MSETEVAPVAAPQPTRDILLQNPVRGNFAAFVAGNAVTCEEYRRDYFSDHHPIEAAEVSRQVNAGEWPSEFFASAKRMKATLDDLSVPSFVAQQDSAKGQHVVICGAGPSLRETAPKWCNADQVWGCNSAATWLYDHEYPVTHGFTVDQTSHMLAEWAHAPSIGYLIASSCNPFLAPLLKKRGGNVTFFHNYCGIDGPPVSYNVCEGCNGLFDRTDATTCPTCGSTDFSGQTADYETWLYMTLFPPTVAVGSGLNAVTRAVDLALYMGFSKITVLGADCALRSTGPMPAGLEMGSPAQLEWLRTQTEMHADGGHALASDASCLTLGGVIDGRYWLTKPDMVVTALWLVWMKRLYGSRLRIMGDTLPKALLHKPDEYLQRLPMLVGADGVPLRFIAPDSTWKKPS